MGKEPVQIEKNLEAYEIDPNYVMEHDFRELVTSISKLFSTSVGNSMEDFGMLPGMEELLSLLKFPELLSWYMEKLFPIGKVAVRILAPISKKLLKVELPNKAAMTEEEKTNNDYMKKMSLIF